MKKNRCYLIGDELKDILKENWDILIILDACRHDYFKEACSKYFNKGNLKKAVSPATHTLDWASKIFLEKYTDIVYISANPFINSKKQITYNKKYCFDAKKHFSKIIDAWDWGWKKEYNSVSPKIVTEEFFKIANTKNRIIIHYMQPHAPYICDKFLKYMPLKNKLHEIPDIHSEKIKNKIIRICAKTSEKIFGINITWKIGKLLRIKPAGQTTSIGYSLGIQGLREAYKNNLELVLEQVKKITDNVNKNILITSDHGEFLGEYGLIGHPGKPRKKENTEVPWYEIKKEKNNEKVSEKTVRAVHNLNSI